jgi:hypothetical protein
MKKHDLQIEFIKSQTWYPLRYSMAESYIEWLEKELIKAREEINELQDS